jgi:hypothetical protein
MTPLGQASSYNEFVCVLDRLYWRFADLVRGTQRGRRGAFRARRDPRQSGSASARYSYFHGVEAAMDRHPARSARCRGILRSGGVLAEGKPRSPRCAPGNKERPVAFRSLRIVDDKAGVFAVERWSCDAIRPILMRRYVRAVRSGASQIKGLWPERRHFVSGSATHGCVRGLD